MNFMWACKMLVKMSILRSMIGNRLYKATSIGIQSLRYYSSNIFNSALPCKTYRSFEHLPNPDRNIVIKANRVSKL